MLNNAVPAGVLATLDLTIFVPCYNEEGRIVGTLETIRAAHSRLAFTYEVIVVDDGSSDDTVAVVKRFISDNPLMPVRLHQNPSNIGLARSFVETAFMGTGRYYRLVCGDNVEPEPTMITLVSQLGTADLIIPYYPRLPGKSTFRRLVSKTYTFLVNLFSGYSIRYYNGCAIYRRFHVMRWAPYNYGFGFQADLVTMLLEEGATYVELPVEGFHFEKASGRSPLNLRNLISTGHTLLEILLRRLRRLMFLRKLNNKK